MSTVTEAAPKKEPEPTVHHDSQEEYESAEEIEGDYDEEEVEEIEIEEEVEEEEEIEEDEEGEGEEDEEGLNASQKEKPLDDDEDRKNPQFIPKKGYFYEHDDRTRVGEGENGEEEPEEPEKKEEKPKRPVDSADKWSHDKFEEAEQAPKSQEELSTTYGYDIRSEDQPPRARRRRRYGRGPTKYTRRWEEEEAYQKPRGGYRGRGRGFSRGSTRRHDSKEEVYEEEFPELGGAASRSNQSVNAKNDTKPIEKEVPPASSQVPVPKRQDSKEEPQIRQEHSRGSSRGNSERNMDYGRRDRDRDGMRYNNREQDRDNDNYSGRGGRGGRGGGGNGMNRRGGRRNEFTNRNRYPNRRDNRDEGDYNDYPSNSNSNNAPRGGGGRGYSNSYESSRDRDYPPLKPKMAMENNNRRGEQKDYRSVVNGTMNEPKQKPAPVDVKHDKPHQSQQLYQQPQQHRIPPFTNTEYPGPGKGNINANSRTGHPQGPHPHRSQNERQNNMYSSEPIVREPNVDPHHSGGGEPQKEVRDLREKLNAMRMQKGYQNQNDRSDRRNQIPPRLQQQQQQQPPQQPDPSSSKPRRYSTQRERTVQPQPAIVTSSGTMVIPNTVAPSVITQGVPNMVPVVTMAEGVVPSTVAAFQPPNFYEGTQVYEASGSPATGNGPSVSPSLWNPHPNAYAAAPYPSPPTAPQVPQPPYADPAAFIGPGAPIYAAPPQFLQDPTLMNYSGPAPPFPPPYHAHPQGFQGYAQVTPAPPPEVYHGGVTYYSTQNQIQRAPMLPPQKRPKSVLQLVEPPEKSKMERGAKDLQSMEHPPKELVGMNPIPENYSEAELVKKLEETTLEPRERKPSPLEFREETSWAEEMELTSPTSFPEGDHFGTPKSDSKPASTEKELQQGESNQDSSKTTGSHKSDAPETAEKSDSVGSTN